MKITNMDVMALERDMGCGGSRPIVCKVYTDEGIYGIGEAAVAIGSGARGAFEVLKDLAPMIIGMDPLAHEVIWEKLFKASFWAQGNGAIMMSAISAIDTALHLEAAIPNFIIHEHHIANTTAGTIAECVYDYQPEKGYFSVPELPGIGQDISDYAIRHAEIVKF